ncbi:MAG: iron ABC transporter permease [Anaerolineales bacterium]|nr:iron ABC transporter permease [Anaerolineales bacterium]
MSRYRFTIIVLILTGVLFAALVLSLGVGAVFIPPERVIEVFIDPPGSASIVASDVTIIRDLRLARVLLATLVGAGLGTAGAAFQALFRNPLADPFVIGASGGAALGATLAITLGLTWNVAGFGPIPLAAFVGSLLAVLVVYTIASGSGGSIIGLLLAGAALSTVLTSVVSLLMLISDESMHQIFSWLMGGFGGRSWVHLWGSGPYLFLGFVLMWLLARPLDALACGDETALTIGLPLPYARGAVVAIATLVTAAAVSAAGIIGFVGLVAPHIARLLFGATHHRLIPTSALIGALLTLLADDLARTVLAPVELPVGIITSLVGGIFFLYLLKSRQRELRGG